jgi:hypothetical protein
MASVDTKSAPTMSVRLERKAVDAFASARSSATN